MFFYVWRRYYHGLEYEIANFHLKYDMPSQNSKNKNPVRSMQGKPLLPHARNDKKAILN
jgi:hypothetical protein